MYGFKKSLFISRSPQDVFSFMSDPANLTKWRTRLDSAEWTSTGVPGKGSTYKQESRFLGRKSEIVFEITFWDPPIRYGYKSVKIPYPAESIEVKLSLASKEHGTQLTFEAQIVIAGIFRLAERMLGQQAEKFDGKSIDTAKQLLEAG